MVSQGLTPCSCAPNLCGDGPTMLGFLVTLPSLPISSLPGVFLLSFLMLTISLAPFPAFFTCCIKCVRWWNCHCRSTKSSKSTEPCCELEINTDKNSLECKWRILAKNSLRAAGTAATTTNKKIPMENSFKEVPLSILFNARK